MAIEKTILSLGPLLFNWSPEKARDFYFRIADEAAIDIVYLGEIVCSKRQPFHISYIPEVMERLEHAGKQVILSTLMLVMNDKELENVRTLTEMADNGALIEANDISATSLLKDKPHAIGPFVNIYNEATLQYFERNGAIRISLPFELPESSLKSLANAASSAELEVQVFGRLPLAISARCYHARSQNKTKDGCMYVCDQDSDGLTIDTIDGEPFLAINGLQTMSHSYCNLMGELQALQEMGINNFRLSPHDTDMVAITQIYRDVLDGKQNVISANEKLEDHLVGIEFSNGFYHANAGMKLVS